MDSFLTRARRLYSLPKGRRPEWGWHLDSQLLVLDPLQRVLALDPVSGKKTLLSSKPLALPKELTFQHYPGQRAMVFSPGGGWLLALHEGARLTLKALATDGKAECLWSFEKGLHYATSPLWYDQGRAWVFLAFRPTPKQNGAELFALLGKLAEPGKFRQVALGPTEKKTGCFAPEEFQGPFVVDVRLGSLLACTDENTVTGVRGTFHLGEEHKLFHYSLRLSEGAPSRQATPIPFPKRGMFQEVAYSPESQRMAVFVAADRQPNDRSIDFQIELHTLKLDGSERQHLGTIPWKIPEGPIPMQLTWLPGGKKLSFSYAEAVYVLDAV